MKKLTLLLLAFVVSLQVNADPWDNLTQEQAEQVINHLKEHPFILDYCDCCDDGEVYLMKVLDSEITTCEWEEEQFSVVVEAVRIGQLEREGYPSAYRMEPLEEKVKYTIKMNYTFVYTECGQWAVPFFKVVDYPRNHVCAGATRFPSPNENPIKDETYVEWYEKQRIDK